MANTYNLITSTTLSTSTASVTFSSLPTTFTDLLIKCSTRSDQPSVLDLVIGTFNGSSASNYDNYSLIGNGANSVSNRGLSQPYMRFGYTDGNSAGSNIFGATEIYIPNYQSSTNKIASGFSGSGNNSTSAADAFVTMYATRWALTSAITSITISPINGPNWIAGSTFQLYGIKNS